MTKTSVFIVSAPSGGGRTSSREGLNFIRRGTNASMPQSIPLDRSLVAMEILRFEDSLMQTNPWN